MAKLFRLSINRGNEIIAMEDEVEHVTNYLTIQKYRYSEKLTYEILLDEKVKYVKTLKLILQPLVENAIYHGIKNKEDGGHIELNIYKSGDKVIMKISDNGAGMSPMDVENIFKLKSTSGSGVGVRNVYERLKLFYGEKATIKYESEMMEGTTVTIEIPFKMEGGVESNE